MAIPLFNIGGLASGLDTNSIIASVLGVERIPIQQLQARKADHQVEDNAWQTVNSRYSAIRTALNAVDSLADFNKLAIASSSNETAVAASVTGSVSPGSVSFTVDQLATTHQVASATNFSGVDALVGAGDFTITIDGTDHTVATTATTTVSDLAAEINGLDAGVSANAISVDGTNYKLLISADDTGAANAFTTSGSVASLGTIDTLQQGVDAELTIGSGVGALTLSRSSNTVTDLISGVKIELKQTTAAAVTVATSRDIDATVEAIKTLTDEINTTLNTLADLTRYSVESDTAGPLAGNRTARSLVFDLRSAISGTVNSASSTYPVASSVGISLTREGIFEVDETKLRTALESEFDEVMDLVLESGTAADSRLSFAGATAASIEGEYEVVITAAASSATVLSDEYNKPNDDTTFQIVVGATTVDVSVLRNDPIATVVQAINDALTGAGVSSVTASEVAQGNKDYIQLDHNGYGSGSSFQVVGDPFGLVGTYTGTDVAGTIGGETATGSGQLLTATAGDPTGIAVQVTALQSEVSGAGGSLSLGDVNYQRGVFGVLDVIIDAAEGSGGSVARARDLTKSQIDLIDDRIEVLEDRLDRREAMLIRQYAALEVAMATLQSQAQWLSSQLASLNGGGES